MTRIVSNKIAIILFLFCVTLATFPLVVHAQFKAETNADQSFLQWAKKNAVPLDTLHVAPIGRIINNAKIVALGEPEHGRHEMLMTRNAVFKYLVTQKGFSALVLEANFANAQIVENYIAGGEGDIVKVAKSLTIADPTLEDIQLISWMRDYNKNPRHLRKLKFYGMDMELIGYPGDTKPSHPALDKALEYIKHVDLNNGDEFSQEFAPFLQLMSQSMYQKLTDDEHLKLSDTFSRLIAFLKSKRKFLIKKSSIIAFDLALHNAIVAMQTDSMIRLLPPDVPGTIPPEAWRASTFRDSCMAENVRWVNNRESKVLVYSHNAHIKNAVTTGGVWDAFAQPPKATGQFLKKIYGKDLFIVGVSSPSIFDKDRPSGLETMLTKLKKGSFVLDLNAAKHDAHVNYWLNFLRPMQSNGVSFIDLRVGVAYDALIFIDHTTPATRIKLIDQE